VEARLLVGATQHGWVTALTHWVSEHGGAQMMGQALTPNDVTDTDFDVLVLDSWSSLLTRRMVDQVQREGKAVLVLVNSERPEAEANRLGELGVSLSLPVSSEAERIVSRAAEVAAVRRFIDNELEDPFPHEPETVSEDGGHRLLVVTGDDGVTEVAVNLAASLSRAHRPTVLVDLDTVRPAIAQRLDVAIVPNLLTASDHIRRSRFGTDSVVTHSSGCAVIPGLANPREWDELSLVDAGELLDGLRDLYATTVAVVHPILEDVAPLSGLEGRFDVGRHTVEKADEVLVATSGSPVGLVRTLGTIADIRSLTEAPIHVVVNRMPPDGFRRAEWSRELTRTAGHTSLWFLPFDSRIPRAAWDGRLLTQGRFYKAVTRMTADLVAGWAT
jgi:MinD-like ATPase involved in chromosome partitioning or flagellar assembly